MPADVMEKSSSSPTAATPASAHLPPDKPRTAADHRKSSKPIMEKRRRARINESLGQLKGLILDALKKDSSRHSKLEKADILEMTVKHLRGLQRAHVAAAVTAAPAVVGNYRAGFHECMDEVSRFLSTCDGVTAEVRGRLLGHLAGCVSQLHAVNYQQQHGGSVGPPLGHVAPAGCGAALPASSSSSSAGPGQPGSPPAEGGKVYGGFQLVPAADGHFAFLVPNPSPPSPSPSLFVPHGGALLPLYSVGCGLPLPRAPPSPAAGGPSLPADSVWRPW